MKCLIESQFGFKPGHLTIDAITLLISDILKSFDKEQYTIAVFCDLSKAFDTINHKVLCNKLSNLGIHDTLLNLVVSYLEN